ncbi:MAG: hypothetical protein M1813_009752 [Trichoglossum hirsutum]|jgi:hypothetical protein|nr:MAG: hypothetical protein M1813_009752 [Trichoglossum hirsutum]
MIGRARYSDLLKLDEARLKTLDGRLVAFAMWVTQQKHETAVGDAARARVARMLDDFDIRYCDHDVEAGTAQHGSFRELVECGSTWIDNFDNCLVNRAYWSNRHQNCFLVVEALSTVRSLMRWRGIGLGAV